jgi:periplasmic divalent cation tolerance protein
MPKSLIVVFVTVPNIELGKTISKALIEDKLVACVNILPKIISLYKWDDILQEEEELLLICKSTADKFEEISQIVKSLHTYQVPEIISITIENSEINYKKWIIESLNEELSNE